MNASDPKTTPVSTATYGSPYRLSLANTGGALSLRARPYRQREAVYRPDEAAEVAEVRNAALTMLGRACGRRAAGT